ncbi:MDR family NADP-dependent oxidoreductase [Aidingimonas lacisalsi]|uniref:MDR family NADP-dependent oxidoreductase n=1 Tax=Aidingimonas lacisalsi TaxID=2604086 RepID=UPI0011D1822F|nr:NADP-dependent oxidoreductase [Aidingimonas lacisalsi]
MQQLRLRRRPSGPLSAEHFALIETDAPRADQAPLQLQLRYISVDPYMRTRMQPSGYDYISRWGRDSLLSGYGIAEVIASCLPDWSPGDWAVGHLPMQEVIAHEGTGLRHAPPGDPPLSWLHPLGMTGFTAWLGMSYLARSGPGDTVLVSAAAGAVGSIAAQLARDTGARVIVTAGRKDKHDWLQSIGFSTVLDHHAPDFASRLQQAVPEGLTLDFENVGGEAFATAIEQMRPGGRVVLCGLISQYQQAQPRNAPANISRLSERGVAIIPFVSPNHEAHFPRFLDEMMPTVTNGRLHWRLDIVHGGLAAVPGALVGLLAGDNLGKRLVAL